MGERRKLFNKRIWATAIGASKKSKRLKLVADKYGCYNCPVEKCDSESFRSRRGCRKHVFTKHGWYYYFEHKPDPEKCLPKEAVFYKKICKPKKSRTADMPSFSQTCIFSKTFKEWISSVGGGSKTIMQAKIMVKKILKFLKFCCQDAAENWDIPDNVVDYCIGNVEMISSFIQYLQKEWNVGFSGVNGYLQALSHLLDFRRSSYQISIRRETQVASEVFIARAKKSISKNMRKEWCELLNIDYLEKIECWASLEELQKVIPFHSMRFKTISIMSKSTDVVITPQELTFATGFLICVLFLLVKASRPMTYQYLTTEMIKSIKENGVINQTKFKTQSKYCFDSLIFSNEVVSLLNSYISHIRSRLNPQCDYLLVSRKGMQLTNLCNIFGRMVFQAIGKYIHPTRYRQIIETESALNLSVDEQNIISEDQKHTSNVAKLHYRKMRSNDIANKGIECMKKLVNIEKSKQEIYEINKSSAEINSNTSFDISKANEISKENKNKSKIRKKKTPFSQTEDNFLKKGIETHGPGNWRAILKDKTYVFDTSRKAATLHVRAKLKGFI